MSATPFPPPRTSPGRPSGRKGQVTAERILDAAEALFAERGFEGTTLRHVAAHVGIRVPSLYNHFESKEALYAAVLDRGIRPVLEELSEFAASGSTDSSALMRRMMQILSAHPELPRLVQRETLAGGQRLDSLLHEWIAPVFAQAYQATEARSWLPEQVPLLVIAIYNVVVGYFSFAPFFKDFGGDDLLAEDALERQAQFLDQLIARLFSEEPRK